MQQTVDVVALTGDVFDAQNKRYKALGPLQRGLRRLEEAEIPVVAVAGNHDFDALPRLAEMVEAEHFHLLGRRQLDDTDTALTVHTLSGADGGSVAVEDVSGDGALRPGRPTSPALPTPDERSHEALEHHLDVPVWTLRDDIAALHLWHLTDDGDLLCRAVEASYRRWG